MHEHDHGHEHCDCGHEHCDGSCGALRLSHTAGATAATARFSMPGPRGPAELLLAQQIKGLAAAVQQRGGLVGHIKAALTGAPEVTTFSCTGGACNLGHRTGEETYTVELVAILLAMEDAVIENLIHEQFPQLGAE